jgi:BNR repeat-like domain
MTFGRRVLGVRRAGVRSLLAATLLIVGCGGGSVSTPVAAPTPTPISLAISPKAASVRTGQAATFTATVANDSAAKGVTWTLAGSGCSGATCGTLSANSSASGAVVTYTAPAAVPGPANATLSATSVADGTKSATATITIAAAPASTIAVTLSQTTATVTVRGTATFIAGVANDTQNKGVTWALSGAGCSGAACGALSAPGSASGAAVTYTAPASVPNPASVTLTATSVTDGTKAAAASITVTSAPAVAVSVSPTAVSLATGGVTQSFTATVQNDSQNKGVTWALSGSACSGAACGTVSPTLSSTGVAVSYTSPANAGTVKLTATSVSNNTASAAATIRLTPPSATGPDNLGVGSAPSTVVDSNGVVDIAWITQEGIEFAQSLDNGATFSTPMLALPLGGLSEQMNIQLDEADDLVIFATFNTNALTPTAILARSTDGGKTFASFQVDQNGINPVLLVEPSGALDLSYLDSDTNLLHQSRSTDGGKTFANDQVLWSPTVPEDSIDIKGVVGAQGQIFLTWVQEPTQQPTICNIFVVSSLDGKKFSQPLQLDDDTACAVNPTPVVDAAGNFNLAWQANAVFFTRSTDQGQTFAKVAQAATGINVNDQHFTVGPNLEIALVYNSAVVGGSVYQVFFTQSVDHGASFSPPQNLSLPNPVQNFTGAGGGDVAVDSNGRITVAFEDDSGGSFSGNFDVYERTSADGQTFSDATNLSNTIDQSELLSQILMAAKGVRYFVWYDVSNAQNSNPVVSVFFDAVQ